MKKFICFLFSIVAFQTVLYSQINPLEYFPLKQGIRWDYVYNSNSTAYKTIKKVDSNKVFIYYDYKPIPKSYSYWRTTVIEVSEDTIKIVARGMYLFDSVINFWENPFIFLISPLRFDNKVNSKNDYYQTYEFELIKKYEQIEVLGAIYHNVIELKSMFNDENITFSFYAKRIGLIREDQIIDSNRKTILELKNYSGL